MTYNVQLSVIVRGSGFWSGNMEFVKVEEGREVQYTPLGGSHDAPLFILTDNGIYRIYCNGYIYRTITIAGMVLPIQPYSKIDCGISSNLSSRSDLRSTGMRCLNYPIKPTDEKPYYFIIYTRAEGQSIPRDKFSFTGIIIREARYEGYRVVFLLEPLSPSSPTIIMTENVISFVGNYDEQQRRRR